MATVHRLLVIVTVTAGLLGAGLFGACMAPSTKAPPPRPPAGLHEDCSNRACQPGLYCYTRDSILGSGYTHSTCETDPNHTPPAGGGSGGS